MIMRIRIYKYMQIETEKSYLEL